VAWKTTRARSAPASPQRPRAPGQHRPRARARAHARTQFLAMRDEDLQPILAQLRDENLKLSLPFGIGLHHAGLVDTDRRLVEELFVNRKIQARRPTRRRAARAGRVRADRSGGHEGGRLLAARRQVLIATSTLAWGVNSPTHLVVIKGTEFFDAKAHRYVDMPITDVLQMMGRAGRPQYDDSGIAVVFVHDVKKNFYKKFLYEPFPVGWPDGPCPRRAPRRGAAQRRAAGRERERVGWCRPRQVVAGTIQSRQDALDYLHWTFYYRRVLMNPSYYGLVDATADALNRHLAALVDGAVAALQADGCLGQSRPAGPRGERPARVGAAAADGVAPTAAGAAARRADRQRRTTAGASRQRRSAASRGTTT